MRYSYTGIYATNGGSNSLSNSIIRDVLVSNVPYIAIYLVGESCSNNLVDSCQTDSTGYTSLYTYLGSHNVFRANHVTNIIDTIRGVPENGVEQCGFGIQGSAVASYGNGNTNIVEYNKVEHIKGAAVDMFWCNGDTIRFNEFSDLGGGPFVNGQNIRVYSNIITTRGTGVDVTNHGPGGVMVVGNILTPDGIGIHVQSNENSASTTVSANTIISPARIEFVSYPVPGTLSSDNIFCGQGTYNYLGIGYSTLASFQKSTGLEAGSVLFLNPPSGTIVVSPDSLPPNGGTVNLAWSSTNATSASITPDIGNVATNGSKAVSINATTIFKLTLVGPLGTSTYQTPVVVGGKILAGNGSGDTEPLQYGLRQNYPNPFNPSTSIEFTIPTDGVVSLKLFDALGREIATLLQGKQSRGTHRVEWNGSNFASGAYFYFFSSGAYMQSGKMLLVR